MKPLQLLTHHCDSLFVFCDGALMIGGVACELLLGTDVALDLQCQLLVL